MKNRDLIFSFDVGHSSIGWNVLQDTPETPNELALGTVIFTSDGCLASKRRMFRRQRRTIRSRRQRVESIEKLFVHQGILTADQITAKHEQAGGNAAPWLLAAAVLAGNGEFVLSAEELFDVIRWYAHNRGYDGNKRWAGNAGDDEDTAKEELAIGLMDEHKTSTMAETICARLGVVPDGHKRASEKPYKDSGAAFPRRVVVDEVVRILQAHVGKIEGCTVDFIETLCGEGDDAWMTIPLEEVKKPKTFKGGLLFGQKVPRFDNRILSFCPITDKPTPLKSVREFAEYRCAMFLANVRVKVAGATEMRPLKKEEVNAVWDLINAKGYLTAGEFKKAVRAQGEFEQDNLESLMIIDDTATNLVVDPVAKLVNSNKILSVVWPALPEPAAKEFLFQLGKKRSITLAEVSAFMGDDVPDAFVEAVEGAFKKDKKGQKKYPSLERWMERKTFRAHFDSGRAPYGRDIMRKAVEEVLSGKDPREEGGCLYITDEIREKIDRRELDELTNNHLVRHRLLILNRLFDDMVDEFADGEKERIKTVVVEVNREVSEMSGKTIQEIRKEEGLKRSDHKKARKKLETYREESGENFDITAGLIRKARIAQDLKWTCPFTGETYDVGALVHKQVDLDHIIPRSERLSDSMAGLVVTFSEVNKMKGKRTACQFLEDEEGNPVKGKPQISLRLLKDFKSQFEAEAKKYMGQAKRLRENNTKGLLPDVQRKLSRCSILLTESYTEKSFTPRDLTISSYVTKLALQQIKKQFRDCARKPQVVALPGRLTGETRKAWNLMGLLHAVNEKIEGEVARDKDQIRSLTHLHHAVDAAVMGLLAYYVRDLSDGATWQLLLKRNLNPAEKTLLRSGIGNIGFDKDRAHLRDVPKNLQDQLRQLLVERRVVQHVPSSMEGLRIEQNTRGILGVDEKTGKVRLHQFGKESDSELPTKLIGYKQTESKLAQLKGVRVIEENFGMVLCQGESQIITWHKVYPQLRAIAERIGRWPTVLRKGHILHVPEGKSEGVWSVAGLDNNARDGLIIKVRTVGGMERAKECRVNTLLKAGAYVVKTRLTGDGICRITSSISTARPSG